MARKTATVSVRVEPALKEEAEKILDGLDVSVSDLITVLYRQIVIKQGVPFPIDLIEDNNSPTENGLVLDIDGAIGYFPKEFIIEAIQTHTNIEAIKAEAVEEFAERLKEKDFVPMITVDNLVKTFELEKRGDNNGNL